jgi:ATP-dependent DNA helicase RecG
MTIAQLQQLKESEDKVEFKEAKHNFDYNGGSHNSQEERRKCYLGYIVAFANEGGGILILGMADAIPHHVVGSDFAVGRIGAIEDAVYDKLGIRIRTEELFDSNGLRILVTYIPSRPVGKTLKYEGVPLMRIGDSLRNMSDAEIFRILSEQEIDFSDNICEALSVDDLDIIAIQKMKEAYAIKQENSLFLSLSNEQALSDLGLVKGNKVTYAALVLLGKSEKIKSFLPQSTIHIEYRNTPHQITFDNRKSFCEPYFVAIEKIWSVINDRNGSIPVQEGPYIFNISYFNKEVIREAINNAIVHRSYRISSEVVIKQFTNEMHILNPGGFPLGVSLQNLLTVNSTPRNRLLADVMAKTGVVERSGQGVDKIFYQTISEGKSEPDYTKSDDFQVELRLSGLVEDKAFALFIKQEQQLRNNEDKLSVHDVLVLNNIRKGVNKKLLPKTIIEKLEKDMLIERIGKTNSQKFILSKQYYVFTNNQSGYTTEKPIGNNHSIMLIIKHLDEFEKAKMSDFENLIKDLTRDQVRYLIAQLVDDGLLDKEGQLKGTIYKKSKKMEDREKFISRAFELGIDQMKKTGELPND